ncbi:hypothetical protein [Thiomicrorhabdus sp.]|uniref:hypothetical protein n=1 Tax=Thiomicrorhabdus sp. TaxID=2039724 RepID=UPI0029C8FFB6|nr:hypothetical protein [Thiomicrorhabdus sp.]
MKLSIFTMIKLKKIFFVVVALYLIFFLYQVFLGNKLGAGYTYQNNSLHLRLVRDSNNNIVIPPNIINLQKNSQYILAERIVSVDFSGDIDYEKRMEFILIDKKSHIIYRVYSKQDASELLKEKMVGLSVITTELQFQEEWEKLEKFN